jgi:Subtilase family
MPFDEERKGDPFPDDFPGRPDHEPWAQLELRLQRQVIELAQRRYEPAIRHELIRLLQRRRQQEQQPQERAAGPQPEDFTRFDALLVEEGFDTLLVHGEILITRQDYDGQPVPVPGRRPEEYAQRYLDELGMEASEVECEELHGRIVRLTNPHMSARELSEVAKVLRTRGFAASVSNITPTSPVGKAIGGPLPVAPADPYQDDPGPGEPAKVAVIDTGITAEIRGDNWLDDVHVPRGDNIDLLDVFPLPGGDGLLDFDAGHGTFVTGIIQQIAPNAHIRVYRALDPDGIASEVTVACEMIRAVRDGADILNLSLGCQTPDDIPPVAIGAALDVIREVERAEGREVIIVAAAGNFGDTRPCWPAAFRRVVSAAALAPDMQPSAWSSRGFWVTCSTIGQGVSSTYVQGQESALVDPDPNVFGPDSWAAWNGTSFAAPQIVGALARLHEKYQYPYREALGRLLAAGRPIPEFGQALKILPGI